MQLGVSGLSLHHGSKIGEVVKEIIESETVYGSWTLMHRYGKCREMLQGRIDQQNRDHVAYLFIWLRYSFTRNLTWQKNYNTKPRDL
jgi:alpha-glucan,water dikinase